jgi:hypothetical protein
MTVAELIEALGAMPAEAQVSLAIGTAEAEAFTVELSDDDWVVLEGD